MPRRPTPTAVAIACAALCVGLGVSAPHALAQNSRQTAPAPMDFDPAHPERVEGWWSNGQELLRLDENGAYRLWITPDRFASPAEVGAWRRSNYVLFDLESYRAKPGTRVRVELVKHEGQTCISRPGMKLFQRAAVPPHVFGDDALGAWVADHEQLLILDNGRYEYRRFGATAGISQHNGIWRTDGESVLLAPDTTAVAPIRLEGQREADGTLLLRGSGGVLRAVRPEPAPVATAPAATTPAATTTPPPSSPPAPLPTSTGSPASPAAQPSPPRV